jgi:hypothetical protein
VQLIQQHHWQRTQQPARRQRRLLRQQSTLALCAPCWRRLPPPCRWQCKLCGKKQSLQRVFARSHSAKDCRLVTQQYNTARGEVEAEDTQQALADVYGGAAEAGNCDGGGFADDDEGQQQQQQQAGRAQQRQGQQRWEAYKEEGDEEVGAAAGKCAQKNHKGIASL